MYIPGTPGSLYSYSQPHKQLIYATSMLTVGLGESTKGISLESTKFKQAPKMQYFEYKQTKSGAILHNHVAPPPLFLPIYHFYLIWFRFEGATASHRKSKDQQEVS